MFYKGRPRGSLDGVSGLHRRVCRVVGGVVGLVGGQDKQGLLVLIEHLPIDGPWAVQPQGRDEKVGEDPAQKGETCLGRDVPPRGTEGIL